MKVDTVSLKVLVMVAAISATTTWAGNGTGGFNGPTTSGVSVPVKIKGRIQQVKVAEAINTCFLTGDKDRGLVSLLQQLYLDAFGKLIEAQPGGNYDLSDDMLLSEVGYFQGGSLYLIEDEGSRRSLEGNSCIKFSGDATQTQYSVCTSIPYDGHWTGIAPTSRHRTISRAMSPRILYGKRSFIFERGEKQNIVSLSWDTETFIPYIVAEKEWVNDGFNDWGEEINGRFEIKTVSVVRPAQSKMLLTNNGRPTKFQINIDDFVNCLSDELVRKSNT